jgi:hypothetical protein
MRGRGDAAAASAPDAELRAALERELRLSVSPGATIAGIERRPSAYRTSFALEELAVDLEDGSRLELVLKDIGPRALREQARVAKPEFLYDPLREIEVYRGPLADARLETAACYGAAVSEPEGRYWLFIERVPGVELHQIGELAVWEEAARWLGRAHSRLASLGAGAAGGRLVAHDAAYYRRWIDRALEFARTAPKARRRRVESLVPAYERATERLLTLPPTLIHGEFYSSNVLVGKRAGRPRICPIDWEVAGFGPGMIDLAALAAGWDAEAARAMERAYLAQARAGGWSGSEASLTSALDCSRLHLAVRWLGWAPSEWVPPPEHRHDWLGEALALAERIGR